MIIAIDFDGSCVTHEYPNIGKDIGAVPVLKKLIEAGHKLILFTMRSDINETSDNDNERKKVGNYLTDAVNWFKENDIELYGINENPTQKTWTTSPKAYAQLYIDDAAIFTPLISDSKICNRPFIDWIKVEEYLKINGII